MPQTDVLERPIVIAAGPVNLLGDLAVPAEASGLVMFAHGSGSSRKSPRNRLVAEMLRHGGCGTLLLDLLTADEERIDAVTREYRFDIDLLADRLTAALDWVSAQPISGGASVGLFGASTGAAAALITAARRPAVAAVVSRGGRPDLADHALAAVQAPTLLIVGGDDTPVIALNESAFAQLRCEKALEIVPGATHLFEEPGAIEEVSSLALKWFSRHFR